MATKRMLSRMLIGPYLALKDCIERGAEVHNSFRQSSREVMIKIYSHKGSGHDIV